MQANITIGGGAENPETQAVVREFADRNRHPVLGTPLPLRPDRTPRVRVIDFNTEESD